MASSSRSLHEEQHGKTEQREVCALLGHLLIQQYYSSTITTNCCMYVCTKGKVCPVSLLVERGELSRGVRCAWEENDCDALT